MKRRFLLFLTVMLVNVVAAFGQTKISGTVIFQDDGEPVIGATVLVDGSKVGTVTDIDGKDSGKLRWYGNSDTGS